MQLPASCPVQTQLVPNPVLHLLSLKLNHVGVTLAGGSAFATTSASRDLSPSSEPAQVKPLHMTGDNGIPGYDNKKMNDLFLIPCKVFTTLGTLDLVFFEVYLIHMAIQVVFALKLL